MSSSPSRKPSIHGSSSSGAQSMAPSRQPSSASPVKSAAPSRQPSAASPARPASKASAARPTAVNTANSSQITSDAPYSQSPPASPAQNPASPQTTAALAPARAMFAKGDVSGALRALEECVKRTPNNSAMLNDYGVALLADKPPQIRPAIAAFTEAVDLGGNSQASYNRARAYYTLAEGAHVDAAFHCINDCADVLEQSSHIARENALRLVEKCAKVAVRNGGCEGYTSLKPMCGKGRGSDRLCNSMVAKELSRYQAELTDQYKKTMTPEERQALLDPNHPDRFKMSPMRAESRVKDYKRSKSVESSKKFEIAEKERYSVESALNRQRNIERAAQEKKVELKTSRATKLQAEMKARQDADVAQRKLRELKMKEREMKNQKDSGFAQQYLVTKKQNQDRAHSARRSSYETAQTKYYSTKERCETVRSPIKIEKEENKW